jgi:hypothetical protein
MVFTEELVKVLKNFSTINPMIEVNLGQAGVVGVKSEINTPIAFYDLDGTDKEIPEFRLYDLSNFLQLYDEMSKVKNFNILFDNERYLTLKADGQSIKYYYAGKTFFIDQVTGKPKTPSKIKQLPAIMAGFKMTSEALKRISKMSDLLSHEHLTIEIKDKKVTAIVDDITTSGQNDFKMELGENTMDNSFSDRISFSFSNLKLIDDYDYNVYIIEGKVAAKFDAIQNPRLTYIVASNKI